MTNTQLYLAIGVPIVLNLVFNTLLIVVLFKGVTDRIKGLDGRINDLDRRMTEGFAAINQRFDDMRDLWRAELRRVEEVLDARLKHLEDHRHSG